MNEADVYCPKCGAVPGQSCRSIKRGGRIGRWPYEFHKKRQTAAILGLFGAPSTKPLTVPVRVRVLKRRARVGAVDSAHGTLL